MSGSRIVWHCVAEVIGELDWQENGMTIVKAGDKSVCIARHQDAYYAFAHSCPHAGGLFSKGWIDALGNVVCPLHKYRFALVNGRNISGEGYKLKTYPLRIDEAGVFVGLAESGAPGQHHSSTFSI